MRDVRGKRDAARRIRQLFPVIACLLLLAAGCRQGGNVTEEKPEEAVQEEAPLTYKFVDVYGEEYEAELLEDVPLCRYDYSRLEKLNGFQYYRDESGEIASRTGIDVSKYQPDADWEKVHASGVEFAMIRLGFRGYGEAGKLVEDECYRKHMQGALDAGLDVGVYFFSQALNEEEAREEARFVLERVKDYDLRYPIVFDTEEIKNAKARTDGLTGAQFTDNCIAFCEEIEAAGYPVMIYANMKWMAFTLELPRLTEYEFWYADYEERPQCPYAIRMWQYTEKGKVPGINGAVDINLYFE